ncbi:hypothetical protein OJ997_34790 [Solirubrobacter phytolaccae]|uniref:Pilus assembly protein n=1 Tax=Solirubrobacter phytolaccae TaxID=1404360 RepID=A0A9X3SF06_9ACTN|nr:hypothetical protein [Solirubrobacter phytolaccae]MDA0185525.1 hypothetical protein [Solirubrobacter phytolaccae]
MPNRPGPRACSRPGQRVRVRPAPGLRARRLRALALRARGLGVLRGPGVRARRRARGLRASPSGRLHPFASTGQASVELVALLPLVVLVLAGAFQAVLAGEAVWQSRVAARAAARAHSLGADPAAAARSHLPPRLERGLQVKSDASGDVRVSVRIPAVVPSLALGRVASTSHFRPQS